MVHVSGGLLEQQLDDDEGDVPQEEGGWFEDPDKQC